MDGGLCLFGGRAVVVQPVICLLCGCRVIIFSRTLHRVVNLIGRMRIVLCVGGGSSASLPMLSGSIAVEDT